MLSFSNFGSVDHAFARRVRRATELVKQRAPDLIVDGEMQMATALNPQVRHEYFPFCELGNNANVLVFPDLQSGNLAMQLITHMGDAVVVGPVLMGTRLPAHLIQYGSSVQDLVNLTAAGIVHAVGSRIGSIRRRTAAPPVAERGSASQRRAVVEHGRGWGIGPIAAAGDQLRPTGSRRTSAAGYGPVPPRTGRTRKREVQRRQGPVANARTRPRSIRSPGRWPPREIS